MLRATRGRTGRPLSGQNEHEERNTDTSQREHEVVSQGGYDCSAEYRRQKCFGRPKSRRPADCLEDETDFAVRPQRLVVEDGSAFPYLQKRAVPNQLVDVVTDVGVDRLVA